jgi:hypothetical protein
VEILAKPGACLHHKLIVTNFSFCTNNSSFPFLILSLRLMSVGGICGSRVRHAGEVGDKSETFKLSSTRKSHYSLSKQLCQPDIRFLSRSNMSERYLRRDLRDGRTMKLSTCHAISLTSRDRRHIVYEMSILTNIRVTAKGQPINSTQIN